MHSGKNNWNGKKDGADGDEYIKIDIKSRTKREVEGVL